MKAAHGGLLHICNVVKISCLADLMDNRFSVSFPE